MTDSRFPSSPPDRPGWWRAKDPDGGGWLVRRFVEINDELTMMGNIPFRGKFTVSLLVRLGWQFAGRVEMPGEET